MVGQLENSLILEQNYFLFDENAATCSQVTGESYWKIIRNWKKLGLNSKGREIPSEKREKIISYFRDFEGNISRISRELNCNPKTIKRVLLEEGIDPSKTYRGQNTALDYFLNNKEKYERLTRSELALKDSNLYCALLNSNTLDKAIISLKPRSSFSSFEEHEIICCWKKMGRNALEVHRNLKISYYKILKILKKAGFNMKKGAKK